ncbi:isopentenyl-diphosphate delta-isomerase [Deferribacter autotrophicus]|uniref:Isopentenyl-diphosphate delta-isomerase n=1 Tax=Deferribacter autotrophicus TaxID=500465 RepID=A0A5A8F1Z7_9BACT|nr:ABC-ATPase domain-containing protein [Deferribacter autotrophicus]KAA0256896.1 isopentenyl-diphosphate delta-isomerase [Deferribacter autotrophicus]
MITSDLIKFLKRINHKGYLNYQMLKNYPLISDNYSLHFLKIQKDPFASPSLLELTINLDFLGYPSFFFENDHRKIAFQDYLLRILKTTADKFRGFIKGSGKSGVIFVNSGGQKIIERSSLKFTDNQLKFLFNIGLPASGRSILSDECAKIFNKITPSFIETILWKNLNKEACYLHVKTYENFFYIRNQLDKLGLIAFIKNGSILPRESSISDKPKKNALKFQSPNTLEIKVKLLHPIIEDNIEKNEITGMGIKKGITVIVGGGYHGKSTLLNALSHAVYPHIPGDGREYVVVKESTMKIRAEDGRFVEKTDITPFINNLPDKNNTKEFSTLNASGSTSQAANIIEAIEMGGEVFLIDEDTSATNFMIRDYKMQKLIPKEIEPITPFIDRVKQLKNEYNISTILVTGGNGDYLDVADTVILMKNYTPYDFTEKAKEIIKQFDSKRLNESSPHFDVTFQRTVQSSTFNFIYKSKRLKIKTLKKDRLYICREEIDLKMIEQIAEELQAETIGYYINYIANNFTGLTIEEITSRLKKELASYGFKHLENKNNRLVKPRVYEIISALNRLRTLKIKKGG